MENKMLAFHGDDAVKEKYLARVRSHREQDQIIHGTYWQKGKGCAVGCTVHSADHYAFERELGIPVQLARLEDSIFESQTNGDAMTWPERFLESIPVGADLSLVWPRFAQWLLVSEDYGVIRFAKSDRSRKAIADVAALYGEVIDGAPIDTQKFASAADAASAAYAADAAYAAAAADAADAAARLASIKQQAAKLLELMAAAPVMELVAA